MYAPSKSLGTLAVYKSDYDDDNDCYYYATVDYCVRGYHRMTSFADWDRGVRQNFVDFADF